ncbi:DUF4179 domain-containing protein [Clostridium paridis]|uniref:DUF4179 domain-containing protein n=1 Tax=Clostridium paridis TaxID=2803863 RepID=A0A937K4S1_9CLOT|nr:DUF4179 domain-containing protein [Clostridium paridis]MBL4933581.1 DUF4179 domain-containing protein [Clostridium paridis]
MKDDLIFDDILKDKAKNEILYLPDDLELKIKDSLDALPARKNVNSRFLRNVSMLAAITLISTTCLSAAFPAYARSLPVVGSVFQFLSDKNLIDRDYVKYSSDLNLSKTSNGVTVTINSISYDGLELGIAYTVESKNELNNSPHIFEKDFKINGEKVSFSSGGTGSFINKNTYVGIENFSTSRDYLPAALRNTILGGNVTLPDNFLMDLDIKELFQGVNGDWNFKFKVSTNKVSNNITKVPTSINLSELQPNLTVNQLVLTPLNTALRTSSDALTSNDSPIDYFAFDDKGRVIGFKGNTGVGNKTKEINKNCMEYIFNNVYEDTKAITFIPAVPSKEFQNTLSNSNWNFDVVSKSTPLNLKEITTLSEGKLGDYKVSKIENTKDSTLVYYQCSNLIAAMGPYDLIIEDAAHKKYSLEKEVVKDLGNNQFVAKIDYLPEDTTYTLKATDLEKEYTLREDLKFTINIK